MHELAERLNIWKPPGSESCRLVPLDQNNRPQWTATLDHLPYQPVGYDLHNNDYQHTYFASAFPWYRRLDCLVFWQQQIIALWPLGIFGDQQGLRLSSHINGAPGVAPPLLCAELSEKQQKVVSRTWLSAIAALCRDFPIADVDFLAPPSCDTLPHWHGQLMVLGASYGGQHRLIVDLTLPEAEYHRQIRKSYKALINSAAKLWHVELDTTGDAGNFAAFQRLHEEVAGRKTRPEATWQRQFDAIAGQTAFALYLRDAAGTLVGASLFNCSRDEAYYAVGAYRRELFDQPLAHLNVFEAIRHARSRGLRRLILGQRAYPGDRIHPTDKEEQIAFFKEGFSTALQVQPLLHILGNRLTAWMSEKQTI